MNKDLQYDKSLSKRAFQRGMVMALGLAFVPIALVSLFMFISGYQAANIDTGLRFVLLLAWLLYVFLADRIAGYRLWMRLPILRSVNTSEVITILAASALLSTMRLNPSMARSELAVTWLRSFVVILLCFFVIYAVFKFVNAARRRARYRKKLALEARQQAERSASLDKGGLKTLPPGQSSSV
ncbi:hypothetical protein RXV86_07585 [Alisedimentitalea sp. MJ-SS2]|uniref:hypothetical protein n=1 Tax=Aliisedimentitalea sp. MJ-SS2 TaxID=3049795 RepID=UPI00290CEE12|nr:hypothetical protein [Alisedimentitalea sp. MJ-SS2]MDU8927241.1 hypothetical protein [Alisedimentitalea sp. MJ-SS2]